MSEPINRRQSFQTLELQREGAVEWLTLNRPDALNAMTNTMMVELQTYFGELATDHSVRVVVLRGAGRAFCAGLDLKQGAAEFEGPAGGMRQQRLVSEIFIRMRRCPQPIISLVQGAASGGGMALALASDVRIASPDMRMNAAFIRLGLSGCDVGVSYFLPRMVGSSVAAELLLTGRFLGAERAERLGLVSQVVPAEEMEAVARELVRDMLYTAPLALRLTKEGLNANIDASGLEAAISLEDRQQILCASGDDFREGAAAFVERREPRYQDR